MTTETLLNNPHKHPATQQHGEGLGVWLVNHTVNANNKQLSECKKVIGQLVPVS